MINYRTWVENANRFVANTKKLPGKILLRGSIAAPLEQETLSALRARWDKRHLPAELVRFWTEGSAHCEFHYVWTPPEDELSALMDVFEYNNYIYGGPQFIAVEKMDPNPLRVSDFDEDMCEDWKGEGDVREVWARSIYFFHIANGDLLGLDCEAEGCDPNNPPVLYLSHETGAPLQLAPRFSEFMTQWEKLSYIGPELWLLDYWLDQEAKCLNPALHKTAALRKLLTPRTA